MAAAAAVRRGGNKIAYIVIFKKKRTKNNTYMPCTYIQNKNSIYKCSAHMALPTNVAVFGPPSGDEGLQPVTAD